MITDLVCAAIEPTEYLHRAPRPDCWPMKGAHLLSCQPEDNEHCTGCKPRPAHEELLVCRGCLLATEQRLAALPRLWDDLHVPTRAGAKTGRGGSTDVDEAQAARPDYAREIRELLRALLVEWCATLHRDWLIDPPTRLDIKAMAAHVLCWSRSLLADQEHAAQLVHDLALIEREGERYAYPAPPPGQLLGRCPDCMSEVRSETTGTARCPGCGATRTIDQWQALLSGDLTQETAATAEQLCAWFTFVYERHFARTTIRQWASRGIKTTEGRLILPRAEPTKDTPQDGKTRYVVAVATRITEHLYGQARIAS